MNDLPLVSIGIPIYNPGSRILELLDKIKKQTYKNIEVIISDNGSTDGSKEKYSGLISKYKNTKIFYSKKNRGSIWNFNKVFKESRGKYFCWFAIDDDRSDNFISECINHLENNKETVLCHSLSEVILDNSNIRVASNNMDTFSQKKNIFNRYSETLNNFPATSIYGVYRSEIVKKTSLFQKLIASDLVFIQELSIYGNFECINSAKFFYRIRDNWNHIDQDYYLFTGIKKKPYFYLPIVVVFYYNAKNIIISNTNYYTKIKLFNSLIIYNIKNLIKKILFKYFICKFFKNNNNLLLNIYINYFHNKNVKIIEENIYINRIIKPILGIR